MNLNTYTPKNKKFEVIILFREKTDILVEQAGTELQKTLEYKIGFWDILFWHTFEFRRKKGNRLK